MLKNTEFTNKLRSSGLRPTKQRLKICEVLFNRDHTFHFTINDLATGDMLLFSPSTKTVHGYMRFLDWMIQSTTDSSYTHVAFVLKDPTFIHPVLKGLYIWESGYEGTPDPQDGKVKFGVQITPLHQCIANFDGQIFVQKN